jgi:hypothetical protein
LASAFGALAAFGPVGALEGLDAELLAKRRLTSSTSASVSADEVVDGNDGGTPNFFTFSMWRPRLAQPFFSASTFSFFRSSLATPPCILSARMVATITARRLAGPPCGT